ncbi:MAG: T9SS type A sorting domain-containing protein [Bacteroidetes bacterium]|nr:T9SS type A sorting domain-containing protein [Bacteroidota bacterium]
MKGTFLFLVCIFMMKWMDAQVPASFQSRGPGGGGALFSPSIDPHQSDNCYISCDMGELFHSTDFGMNYSETDFRQVQGGHNSKVAFTSNPQIRYCISYANNAVVPMKTTDGGSTWNILPGNPDPSEEAFGIWTDHLSTGRIVLSYYGSIWYSQDGGNSFTNVYSTLNMSAGVLVGGVFFDGSDIFIGTNEGLLVSHNSGSSFTRDSSPGIPAGQSIYSFGGAKSGSTIRFFALTGDSLNIYVGLAGSDYWSFIRGVYRMDYSASGSSWISSMSGIVPSQDWLMFVGTALNNVDTAYLAGSTYLSEPNVMRTTNGGQTWQHVFLTSSNQNIATGWCGSGGDRGWGYAECPFGFTVAPNDAKRILMTDYGFVHKSSDAGNNWIQAYVSSADQHAPGTNTPANQSYHSCGIENTSCWDIRWTSANHLFAGYSDIRGVKSVDGGNSWSFNYTGHSQNSMYKIVKNIAGPTLYAATSTVHDIYQSTHLQDATLDASNAGGKVIYSNDEGATWQTLHDFAHPVFTVTIDPNNVNRLYAAVVNHSQNAGGIWVSQNINLGAGSTWTQLSAPGRTEGHPHSIFILNDGTLVCTYTGRRNSSGAFTQSSGVFIYNPGLQVWSDKSDVGMFYWTRDLTIDPTDPNQNTWLVSVFSGWGGAPNGKGGLYRTTDRGNTWTKISNLDRVASCTFNPNNPDQVFICTEGDGLWTSTDIHATTPTFQPVLNYPFYFPWKVLFNPYQQDEMWVTSFGNGIKVASLLPTIVKNDRNENSEIKIYPNPASDFITLLNSGSNTIQQMEIFDSSGKKLFSGKGIHEIDISAYPAGNYYLMIRQNDRLSKEKFIIRR